MKYQIICSGKQLTYHLRDIVWFLFGKLVLGLTHKKKHIWYLCEFCYRIEPSMYNFIWHSHEYGQSRYSSKIFESGLTLEVLAVELFCPQWVYNRFFEKLFTYIFLHDSFVRLKISILIGIYQEMNQISRRYQRWGCTNLNSCARCY